MEEAIVSFVVEKVGDLLIDEAKFLYGVSDKVGQLQTELNWMRCFLRDADARREQGDERVRNWVAEIREATYDADDVIATFIVEVALKRRRGGFRNIFNEFFVLHKVGSEIEAINTNISNLTRSLETHGVKFNSEGEPPSTSRQRLRPRSSYPHIVDVDVVGLEELINTVVAHLVEDGKQSCRVVSLWGMGGVGKTTLAKKVYSHGEVRHHFDCVAWAYISQTCQERDVLEGILSGLVPSSHQQIEKMRYEQIAEELYKVQIEKKCLVILDDIWDTGAWDALSAAFPIAADGVGEGSKILLTTRNRQVGLYVDRQCFLHELRPLNEEESWQLFANKAFPQTHENSTAGSQFCTDKLEIGKEMLSHCRGLPLAILTLGGLLATKNTIDEWKTVKQNLNFHLRRGTKSGGVSDVLALSYWDLPYHLKACFLHLSHFQEDFMIDAEKLVRIWVAEGFVSCTTMHDYEGEGIADTMVGVAKSYLSELVGRCMVQVVQLTKLRGRVKFCQLHDLMRDFCLSKAKEDNFLKLVHFRQGNWLELGASSTISTSITNVKIRRLAVCLGDNTKFDMSDVLHGQHHFRSMLFFSKDNYELPYWRHMKLFFNGLNVLRVLNLEGFCISKLPEAIGNLKHLRYLRLNISWSQLPSSIGNLRCLQTLDLRSCWMLFIPNVLWKMEQLRDLYLPHFPAKCKLRLDGLSHLEVLKNFRSYYCEIQSVPNLTNLRELKECVVNIDKLGVILPPSSSSTSNLRYSSFQILGDIWTKEEQTTLRHLLECHHLHKLELWGFLVKLPEHRQFPSNLIKLCFRDSRLKEDPMPTLEKLPNLRSLVLDKDSFFGKEMVCTAPTLSDGVYDSGFPQLKYLRFRQLYRLEEWRVDEGALPNLLCLEICSCDKLKRVPDGLRFVTSLQELMIKDMPEEFENSLREGGQDFNTVQHVPSVNFYTFYGKF